MVATPQEIAELESFFKSATLPIQFRLNAATSISDLPAFVDQVLRNLKNGQVSDTALRPRYDDLLVIKAILSRSDSQI